jgi:hypothetical protein
MSVEQVKKVTIHIGTEVAAKGTEGVIAMLEEKGVDGKELRARAGELDNFIRESSAPAGFDITKAEGALGNLVSEGALIALLGKDGYVTNGTNSYMMAWKNDPLRHMGNLKDRLKRDTGVEYSTVVGGGDRENPQFVWCSVSNPGQ